MNPQLFDPHLTVPSIIVMESGNFFKQVIMIIEHMIYCLLMVLFDMANLSSKGKQKVLILETVSLLDKNHSLAVVAS